MALAPRVTGKPMSKLSPAKLTLNSLISTPLIQKVSSDFSLIKGDLGVLANEITNEAAGYFSAHPFSTAGALVGLTVLEVLLVISRHQSHGYQLNKAVDPKTSLKKRSALCQGSAYPDIRRIALEEHKDIPEKVVLEMGRSDPDPKVRAEAIRHPNFPESALREQISNGQVAKASAEVKKAVMERLGQKPLSEEAWVKLLNNCDPEIRGFFLLKLRRESQDISAEMIRKLFNCQYPDVKWAIIKLKGVKIPEDVIRAAAQSKDLDIKLAVFEPHQDVPEDLLLANIKDAKARPMVLEHPKTPSHAIAEALHELHIISKVYGSDELSTITSVLKQHSSQKASEILNCLEKIDLELTKNVKNSLDFGKN